MSTAEQMKGRLLDRRGLERLASRKAAEKRELKRAGHEVGCSGVRLAKRPSCDGIWWYKCTGCGYTFNDFTEGVKNLLLKSTAVSS